jgi:RHS repeat-associated protein
MRICGTAPFTLYEVHNGLERFHIMVNGQRICTIEPETGDAYYEHGDHLGSASILTGSTGTEARHWEYTPYGRERHPATPTPWTVSHRFTGQVLDEETGLYYYNARYYDPELGRFIQPDTIIPNFAKPQALNRYSYVYNNPLLYVDPSGHQAEFGNLPSFPGLTINWQPAPQTPVTQPNFNWTPNSFSFYPIPLPPEAYRRGSPNEFGLKDALMPSVIDTYKGIDANLRLALDSDRSGLERAGSWSMVVGITALGILDFVPGTPPLTKPFGKADNLGPTPFAMGIDDHLDDFARQHGATTWKQFADQVNWKPQVFDNLADPSQRVLFNLDGVDIGVGIQRAASGRGGATDWELLQIKLNDFPNLEFWKRGEQVPNPFK